MNAGAPVAGRDGLLVPARAGDALVFFSFGAGGEPEPASLHSGRRAGRRPMVASSWPKTLENFQKSFF